MEEFLCGLENRNFQNMKNFSTQKEYWNKMGFKIKKSWGKVPALQFEF